MEDNDKQASETISMTRELSAPYRSAIGLAVAKPVVPDLRPLSFSYCTGMAEYSEAVFKAGQSVPAGMNVARKSYIPGRTLVADLVTKLAKEFITKFRKRFYESIDKLGGGATIDGVSLKVQGRHYFDFTVHYIETKKATTLSSQLQFGMKTNTILLVEGPANSNAASLRLHIDQHLETAYGLQVLCSMRFKLAWF